MYGKLFGQMFDGTLSTRGPWQALVTFQQFIILADKNGIVDMTPEAISRRTTIPLEIIQEGIVRLMEPDPESRSPAEEGKRIAPLSDARSWGWQIVNYQHYRNLRSTEERRQYHQQYYHNKRKVRAVSTLSTDSTKAVSSKQYAVSSKQKNKNKAQAPFVLPDWIPQEHWQAWIDARAKVRKTPTDYTKRLAVAKLDNYREQGIAPAQVLMQSAFNNWSGLFPPKEIK